MLLPDAGGAAARPHLDGVTLPAAAADGQSFVPIPVICSRDRPQRDKLLP